MFEILEEYPYLITVIWLLIIGIAAAIIERLVTRWLKRLTEKTEWPPDVENGLILMARLIILVGALIAILHVGGVPTDILVSLSALGGAAIGFASTRTVGNLIAGFYLLIARPFHVGDYVKIDGTEGVVQEITINYAKILTPKNTVISISTQRILDKEITNYRFKGEESNLYCYGFELSFDHSLPTEKLEELLDKVIGRYAEMLPKKPEYQATKLTRLDRSYIFYIYVEDPKDIFILQPKIMREIIQAWDKAKAANQ